MDTQETVRLEIKKEIKKELDGISDYSEKIKHCNQILSDIATKNNYKNRILDDHTINVLYGEIPGEIFGLGEPYFTTLLSGWNLLNKLQVDRNRKVYKASIAAFLAMNYRRLEDRGATFRWALLTQAADLLDRHSQGGGTGRALLTTEFGFDNVALNRFKAISETNLGIINDKQDWSIPEAFAEDIVTKFAFMYPEYSLKFAAETNITEYEINPEYFGSLIERVNGPATSTTELGNSLEQMATYLFLLIPGLVPRRNVLDVDRASEFDIVVRNLSRDSAVITDLFGRFILAECKNWKNKVGVQDVGYFLYRMRLTHSRFGVLFAKKGITGNPDKETAARSLIRRAFHEDGNICISIDHAKLEMIHNRSISFLSCMMSENEKIRFGSERP